ncbi:IS30 family transposase, partial [Herbiconiux sp. CPCC 203407]
GGGSRAARPGSRACRRGRWGQGAPTRTADGEHTAEVVRDVLIELIRTLPKHLRGSLIWDQGAEMAGHKAFKIATRVPVYFCDPASPWQRVLNENTNGLLRQYFPKSTDLAVYGPEDLEHVAQKLNCRPCKTLGWKLQPSVC